MLERKGRAKPVVVVGIAISDVSVKYTGISTIIAIATTFGERIGRWNSLIPIL